MACSSVLSASPRHTAGREEGSEGGAEGGEAGGEAGGKAGGKAHPTRGWAAYECLGLALVRSVDEGSGMLFLSTPVPHADLARVRVLARAALDPPLALLQPTTLTAASPYLAADALTAHGAGGKQMRSRNNLLRGAQPKAAAN